MNYRILIVDDDERFRFAAGVALRKSGYAVDYARDGRQALEKILSGDSGQAPFDLVLTDLLMPRMNGFELIDALRKSGSGVSVLVITGYLDSTYRLALQARGYPQTIEKPLTPEMLVRRMEKILDAPKDQKEDS